MFHKALRSLSLLFPIFNCRVNPAGVGAGRRLILCFLPPLSCVPAFLPGSDGKDPSDGPGKAPQHPRASLFLICSMAGFSAGSSPSQPLPVIIKVIINFFLQISCSPQPYPFSGFFREGSSGRKGPCLAQAQVLGVPPPGFGAGSAWRCPRIHQESLDCSKKSLVTLPFQPCHHQLINRTSPFKATGNF